MSLLKNAKELAPCVLMIDDAIENPQEVIDLAKKSEKTTFDAEITSSLIDKVNKEIRDTKIFDIFPIYENDVFWWILAQKIWKYGDEYGKKYNINFSNMEFPQLLWYTAGQGFYKPHSDSYGSSRTFSAVLYLNDVSEGGETHFEHFNISVKPKAGRLILFPANFSYLHGAKKPISNDKYAVVTWFNP